MRAVIQASGESVARSTSAPEPHRANQRACNPGVGKSLPNGSARAPITVSGKSPELGQREKILLCAQILKSASDHCSRQFSLSANACLQQLSCKPQTPAELPQCSAKPHPVTKTSGVGRQSLRGY